MTPELTELARRVVACPRWRWMPGMLVAGPGWFDCARLCDVDPASGLPDLWEYRGYVRGPCAAGRSANTDRWDHTDAYPDLTDPATLGCLTALVREAWGDPEAHLALGAAGWVLMSGESRVSDVVYPSPAGRTEAEALVNALEATP